MSVSETQKMKYLQEINEEYKVQQRNINDFETNIYPAYTFEERVTYWSGVLYQQMRWQEEEGLNPYDIYNLQWYEYVKNKEPDFDEIMDTIFTTCWNTSETNWSKEKYLEAIKEE